MCGRGLGIGIVRVRDLLLYFPLRLPWPANVEEVINTIVTAPNDQNSKRVYMSKREKEKQTALTKKSACSLSLSLLRKVVPEGGKD